MFLEEGIRLVLRYEPGQFSFSHLNQSASDEDLYDLANQLNSFQTDQVREVRKVSQFLLAM